MPAISRSMQLAFVSLSFFFLLTSCPGGSSDSGGSVNLPAFTDVSTATGVGNLEALGQTAAWGDFNSDGRLDLIATTTDFLGSNVFLFRNNGSTFVDVTLGSGISDLPVRSATWADYDNDGLLDLVVGTIMAGFPPILYGNVNGSFFEDLSESAGITGGGVIRHTVWGDFDANGFVDLFQANLGVSFLYRNQGDGTFAEVSLSSGLGDFFLTNSATWFDYNNDGFPDLFLANDGMNILYRNNKDGTFTDVTNASGIGGDPNWNSVAACVGDFNGDGLLDLYVGNIAATRNALYRNNGGGTFTDVTLQAGTQDVGDARTCAWVDFDGDGWIDLFATNHVNPSRLYRNLGNGEFRDVAPQVGIDSPLDVFSAAWGDYNNDGFVDSLLNGHIGMALMENGGNGNNFLIVELAGDGILTNTSAIGTRVEVSTSRGGQIREVSGGKGCCEQDMLPLHFGLGQEIEANIRVEWSSGAVCLFDNLNVQGGRMLFISEAGCELLDL